MIFLARTPPDGLRRARVAGEIMASIHDECVGAPRETFAIRSILPSDDAFRAPIGERGDVEIVARHHHHVEIVGDVEHLDELRERIMEVGYEEESHKTPLAPESEAHLASPLARAIDNLDRSIWDVLIHGVAAPPCSRISVRGVGADGD